MNGIAKFAKNLLLWVDQGGNVVLLGSPDETISARSYREGVLNGKRSWAAMRWFVDKLFWFEPDHTKAAYEAERARCHLPADYHLGACDTNPAPVAPSSEKPDA